MLLRRPPEQLPLRFGHGVGILEARLVQSLLHALPVYGLVEAVEVVVPEILLHRDGIKLRFTEMVAGSVPPRGERGGGEAIAPSGGGAT